MDRDENPATLPKYYVRNVPMLIVFKNGQVVDSFVGMNLENVVWLAESVANKLKMTDS